ncbi:sugar fermentation stimulation protein [Desulfocapsa sulfexigens DSM 10523]|uniref:Sugar fermentation stimulation protein homolog n=1 Tax=Desulfocapsa sulfexigens (strain DSM 10523 / SB164P1) TaxID=1167006 RepID=M1P6N1_DESSD|nr:DNA/RNA nuclease SfsA [Desulfocapsa sulfexigens]AGF77367.1 sugar fermentation stimulation protein [Desulfocapsa sulfexigens DSM 10523]
MQFETPLQSATLVKRYKRFLADVTTAEGRKIIVYCPNTGTMRSCSTPGSQVMLSTSPNLNRKYPQTLEMIRENDTWIGVNTGLTNTIVAEAIHEGRIKEFQNIDRITREIVTSKSSRLDLLLEQRDKKIYVEIKNCSLVEEGWAMFPDAVTTRGTKHLEELASLVKQGHQGVIFFCIQRSDADRFRPAAHIDPVYASTLAEVSNKGVQIIAYQAEVRPESISIRKAIPCFLK